jgi:hypothetical protein
MVIINSIVSLSVTNETKYIQKRYITIRLPVKDGSKTESWIAPGDRK